MLWVLRALPYYYYFQPEAPMVSVSCVWYSILLLILLILTFIQILCYFLNIWTKLSIFAERIESPFTVFKFSKLEVCEASWWGAIRRLCTCYDRLNGNSRITARQRISTGLMAWPGWEQLAGHGLQARSVQRWCSSDLLRLLKSKLSQRVFIWWHTRLWLYSNTALDLHFQIRIKLLNLLL